MSTVEEIAAYLEGLEKEAKQIKSDLLKMSWYMRGGISYEHIMMLSSSDRLAIGELIKENMEITKKSGLPHF